jgi:hypothetical protein
MTLRADCRAKSKKGKEKGRKVRVSANQLHGAESLQTQNRVIMAYF